MASYSKSRVDKAGRFFAEQLQASGDGLGKVGEPLEEIEETIRVLDWWRAEHVEPLSVAAADLFRYVADEGTPIVAQRLKRLPTIALKLLRTKGMRLSQMEDVGGVRAVLPNQGSAYRVAARLQEHWTITRFRDYVSEPKPDGYRALHLVSHHQSRLIEVQLRTPRQDEWANAVEGATQRFAGLKSGGGPIALREFFIAASEIYAMLDGGVELSESRLAELQVAISAGDTFVSENLHEP